MFRDQSAPRKASTNDAIDGKKFPADMGGMKGILACFSYVGRGSRMSKCDWCDAYKHVGGNQSQWQYQWFEFAGECTGWFKKINSDKHPYTGLIKKTLSVQGGLKNRR